MSTLTTSINIVLVVLSRGIKEREREKRKEERKEGMKERKEGEREEERKDIQIGKDEVKLAILADDMILYTLKKS